MSGEPLPPRRRRRRPRQALQAQGTFKGASDDASPDKNEVASKILTYDHVVIGGGIAGVACVRQLVLLSSSSSVTPSICLVTASPSIKDTTNVVRLTETLESFDVVERPLLEFLSDG